MLWEPCFFCFNDNFLFSLSVGAIFFGIFLSFVFFNFYRFTWPLFCYCQITKIVISLTTLGFCLRHIAGRVEIYYRLTGFLWPLLNKRSVNFLGFTYYAKYEKSLGFQCQKSWLGTSNLLRHVCPRQLFQSFECITFWIQPLLFTCFAFSNSWVDTLVEFRVAWPFVLFLNVKKNAAPLFS